MNETPSCTCFSLTSTNHGRRVHYIHAEEQNTDCDAWKRLTDIVQQSVETGVEVLSLREHLSARELPQIVSLPNGIGQLKGLRKLDLYGSSLVRLPEEIGELTNLEFLDTYTSYRLHWYPYELARCPKLRDSRVSNRALYGNYKFRPPFPDLKSPRNAEALWRVTPSTCSICRAPLLDNQVERRWISLRVATDVLPLLVNACSCGCLESLPEPAEKYVQYAHTGGVNFQQPEPSYTP